MDAAVRLLDAQPDTSVEAIATAAGVTRQTVYAHFPSREQLLAAALDRLTEEVVAAMDDVEPDAGPAAAALLRVLDASSRAAARYHVLLGKIGTMPATAGEERDRHAPVADRLERVIRRGLAAGEFDDGLPAAWLVSVTIRRGHAAAEEADAGRMSTEDAAAALRTSLLRVLVAGPGVAAAGQPAADPGSTSPVAAATAKTTSTGTGGVG